MAGYTGTKIVTDGLVLCLDATNIKSYPGLPPRSPPTEWMDISGNTNDFSGVFSGPDSDSFQFDGISDYFEQWEESGIYSTNLDIFGDVTAEVWFRISSFPASGYVRLFGKGGPTRLYGLWYSSGSILYQRGFSDPGFVNAEYFDGMFFYENIPQTNQWYHIVGTSKGADEHRLYINGSYASSTTNSVTMTSVAGDRARIGVFGTGGFSNYHNGDIANVKLYNRALSPEEVRQNFNAHRGRFSLSPPRDPIYL